MQVIFKLYASLSGYLPPGAQAHQVTLDVPEGTSPMDLLTQYQVPADEVHLVFINGVFIPRGQRNRPLEAGDELAAWPAIAGG